MRVTIYGDGVIEFRLNKDIYFLEKVIKARLKTGDYIIEDIISPVRLESAASNQKELCTMHDFGWSAICKHDYVMDLAPIHLSPAGSKKKTDHKVLINFRDKDSNIRIYNLIRDEMEKAGYLRITITDDRHGPSVADKLLSCFKKDNEA